MKSKFTNLSFKNQDKSNTVKFYVNKEKGTVVCRLYDRWYDIYHTAKAQCLDTDKWNEKKGRAIAFNRARMKELNHNIDMINIQRGWYENSYRDAMARFDKQERINQIYLAGVIDEIKDLTE